MMYEFEVCVVEDFVLNSHEPLWLRGKTPQELFAAHLKIKFVLNRLGDRQKSSLQDNSFDIIYSVPGLEHDPDKMLAAAWQRMDAFLKPGGDVIHAIEWVSCPILAHPAW